MTGLLSPFFPFRQTALGASQKHESVEKEMSATLQQHNKFQKQRQIKTLTLQRKNERESWGFELTGGWEQGQWIGKTLKF